MARKKKIKVQDGGLGDVVEKITEVTGIKKLVEHFTPEGKDCGCDKRKKQLNDLFPRNRKALRCFTQEQYNKYQEYKNRRTIKVWETQDIQLIIDLYAHIFAVQYHIQDFCRTCEGTAKKLFKMTEQLDKVHDSYEE